MRIRAVVAMVAASCCVWTAYAVGYTNNFDNATGMWGGEWNNSVRVPAYVDPNYAPTTAVTIDFAYDPSLAAGYQYFWLTDPNPSTTLNAATFLAGSPYDLTGCTAKCIARYNDFGTEALGTAHSLWMRIYAGVFDPNGAPTGWTLKARAAFDFTVPSNTGWATGIHAISAADANGGISFYNGGSVWDPTAVMNIRFDFPIWDAGQNFPGQLSIDLLKIIVNAPPVANAGADQTGIACCSTATLNGSGSTDSDGTVVDYKWTDTGTATVLQDGPSPSLTFTPACGATTTVQLTVKDDFGATASDTVNVTALPPAVTANAGPDQNVSGSCSALTAVTLSGSGTGGVTAYEWKDESGAVVGSTASTGVNLMPGNHTFTLTVTGACAAATASDTVHVTVSPVNGLPINLSMGTQINTFGPGYDTIVPGSLGSLQLEVPAADTTPGWEVGPWTRQWLVSGNWYFTPAVNLRNACYDVANLSNVNVSITARYLNDTLSYTDPNQAYIDTPIGIRFYDVTGKRGVLNTVLVTADPNTNNQWWFYGPNAGITDPNVLAGLALPPWKTYSGPLYFDTQVDPGDTWIMDVGFDPTKVVSLEFWGTDWYGSGFDFVDLKALSFSSAVLCGDANCDGLVNNADIDAFVMALTDPVAYAATYGCAANCDTNHDTLVNNGDIDSFVAAVIAGGCP